MNLYQVVDDDGQLYVLAEDFAGAVASYRAGMMRRFGDADPEGWEPNEVRVVAEHDELLFLDDAPFAAAAPAAGEVER